MDATILCWKRVLMGLLVPALLISCEAPQAMSDMTIIEAQEELTEHVMSIPGVTGTGIGETGDGEPCISVFVEQSTAAIRARIPQSYQGYPVVIEAIGELKPHPDG